MPNSDKPDPLEGLAARIAEAKGRRPKRAEEGGPRDESSGRFLSMAMRIGVELVAALVVAMGAGWLLDRWLGTRPWLMIVFFFLGSAAGIMNVYRAVNGLGLAPGYRRPDEEGRE
jgi:ATP synthase protein I